MRTEPPASTLVFLAVTLARPLSCAACGAPLAAGERAHCELGAPSTAILCRACFELDVAGGLSKEAASHDALAIPASALKRPLLLPPTPARRARKDDGSNPFVALGAPRAFTPAPAPALRRALETAGAALRAALRWIGARLRGVRHPGPRVARRAFEELGPTYVKLGQLIASSHGLFPERYRVELRGCLDAVPPAPLDHVLATIERELGAPATRIFDELAPAPLASASIAQVHAARLRSGEHVVVKVQRPGLDARIGADLRILKALARFSERWDDIALASPTDIVLDLEANLWEELDFVREASNMREFSAFMAACGEHEVVAPRVHGELSTRHLIVMERFFGHRIDDVAAIERRGIDAEAALVTGLRSWFRALLQHGFFHADVHAGNLMALEDGRIGFLDFGIVGRLSRERRAQVMAYLLAMAAGDFPRLAEVMRAMTGGPFDADLGALGGDLAEAFAPLVTGEHGAAKYADMIPHLMRIGVRHRIKLPRDFVLITKQMIYFDRYARLLAPNLNLFRDPRVLQPIAVDLMLTT